MNNNEIFKQIMHLLGFGRNRRFTKYIFELGGMSDVTQSQVRKWRATEGSRYSPMPDRALNCFIRGLFEYRDQQREEEQDIFVFPRDEYR
jgi:hypothetical protein